MSTPDFSLFPASSGQQYVRRWVQIAVGLLAVSGLAPLILIAGRGSFLADSAPVREMFHAALVVHVDLSVLAWFLALLCLFWALLTSHAPSRIPVIRGSSQASFAAGGLLIALAPLVTDGTPLMSNYIPVFTSSVFFLGLGLLLAGTLLALLSYFTTPKAKASLPGLGVHLTVPIIIVALLCFGEAYQRIQANSMIVPGTQEYYEILFWAGGHVLQLAITQLLLVAWLWLAQASGVVVKSASKILMLILWITPLVALSSIKGFMGDSEPYDLHFFTMQMRHGGGIAALLLGGILFAALLRYGKPTKEDALAWSCLVVSILVFATGGVVGYMITESNTIIPAHYHGSIVGTTTAFMGIIYLLLPNVNARAVAATKLSIAQPWLYGGGSLLHVIGFAIAGGHGAARKTVEVVGEDAGAMDTALQVMRLGGSLAVLGGAIFVVLAIRALWKKT